MEQQVTKRLQINARKLIRTIKSMGVAETAYWVWVGYLLKNTFFVYTLELDKLPFSDASLDQNIRVKKYNSHEWAAERKKKNFENLPREFYYDEVYGLRTCYVGYFCGEIAHINWALHMGDPSRFFELKDKEAQPDYAVTIPKFSGKKLYTSVFRFMLLDLKTSGITRVFAVHHEDNQPPIRVLGKLGFKRIGKITHWGPYRPRFRK
jgi:hypothetical protein